MIFFQISHFWSVITWLMYTTNSYEIILIKQYISSFVCCKEWLFQFKVFFLNGIQLVWSYSLMYVPSLKWNKSKENKMLLQHYYECVYKYMFSGIRSLLRITAARRGGLTSKIFLTQNLSKFSLPMHWAIEN